MARREITPIMKQQVFTLYDQGKPIKAIARALQISKNTVRSLLRGRQSSPSPKEPPSILAVDKKAGWRGQVDWTLVVHKLKSGVTIKQTQADYAPAGVSYWAFIRAIRVHSKKKPEIALRLQHNPGEKTQVDFADGVNIWDQEKKSLIKTHLFCGVLPFSSYVFGSFVFDQKLPTFISVQEKMWHYFGGVTPYVVVDNLKSAVNKAHRYDPDKNPTYCDFGNHYGFAVLPARPYEPRDKATVEATIGVIQKTFYQEVKERLFHSLHDLNACFAEFLIRLNSQVMKDYGVSRKTRFEEEMKRLLPLPNTAYEISEWKQAKVHPDCCIQVGRCFYSLPFQFVGQLVRVQIKSKIINVYSEGLDLIATHTKSEKVGAVFIVDDHLPDQKMQQSRFEVQKAMQSAKKIGPRMAALFEDMFARPRALTYLRRAQGMLRLYYKNTLSKDACEYAASQIITFRKYRLKYFEECGKSFMTRSRPIPVSAPIRDRSEIYVHQKGVIT